MTLTLYQALDIFQENIPDIISSMSLNLASDIAEEKKEAEVLGTGEIADMVRSIRMEDKFSDRTRRLNSVRSYHNAMLHPSPGQITPTDIDRARSYPIQDLYPGKLRKQGGKMWGTCPLHTENTASFTIDTKRNNWRCFGACGVGGDAIDFYMRLHKVKFIQAVRKLANCGQPPFHPPHVHAIVSVVDIIPCTLCPVSLTRRHRAEGHNSKLLCHK